jgi:hypothetical protein
MPRSLPSGIKWDKVTNEYNIFIMIHGITTKLHPSIPAPAAAPTPLVAPRRTKGWIPLKTRMDQYLPVTNYTKNAGQDFGLCASAFEWKEQYPGGSRCLWRHHPLLQEKINNLLDPYPKHVRSLVSDYTSQESMRTQWDQKH